MTSENPQFFVNRSGRRLFAVLHDASPAVARSDVAVVCCAPLFEEKLWSHRVLVNLARFLALRGIAVLRFDYFGDGESEGLFEEASVASRIDDSLDAVAFCRQATSADRVLLLGLRYGANIATCAALVGEQVDGAVAWAPIMDGANYVNELLRAHLTAQMVVHRKVVQDRDALVAQIQAGGTVNVEGYEISSALYGQMAAMSLTERLRGSAKPILVQQISPGEDVERQYAALQGIGNPLVQFQKVREPRFWTQQKVVFPPCEELFNRTAEWLVPKSPET